MTSAEHCGTCDTSCSVGHEECEGGHCVDQYTSCAKIHGTDATLATGMYTLVDQTPVYCDMAHSETTYDGLALGQYDSAPAGYDIITLDVLQTVPGQTAFTTFINNQGGYHAVANWTIGNCCIKWDTSTNYLSFGAPSTGFVFPGAGSPVASSCGAILTTTNYTFTVGNAAVALPLASTYFTTNPPSIHPGCTNNANPAFFWRKRV